MNRNSPSKWCLVDKDKRHVVSYFCCCCATPPTHNPTTTTKLDGEHRQRHGYRREDSHDSS
jgi:hypothetical protein